MEIHHGKHHNAYVTNLNNAISGMSLWSQNQLSNSFRILTQYLKKLEVLSETMEGAMQTTHSFGV